MESERGKREREDLIASGFSPLEYRRLSRVEVDNLYDLTGWVGFHGFSCHRWVPHFVKKKKTEVGAPDIMDAAKERV